MAKDTKKKNAERFRRTIAVELFNQWRKLQRKGDSEAIAKELNLSKPTIDKALIYGFVHQQAVVDGITKYFADRILAEKETANKLADMAKKTS